MANVAVIGLGRLGAPLAAVLAYGGHRVIGVDLNVETVDKINNLEAPVVEPELQELLDTFEGTHKLTATTSFHEAVSNTEIAFVIVPTPSGDDNAFVNDYVLSAVERLGAEIKHKEKRYTVVISSTVMPGSVGGPIRKALEDSSEKKVGERLGLVYSPEFIALGSVIKDLTDPDMVLVGQSDHASGQDLINVMSKIVYPTTEFKRMTPIEAEIAKISVNSYVTMKISFANQLAETCENVGADAHVVTEAIGWDSRIGKRYIKPGPSYGGTCFPRDSRAFNAFSERAGTFSPLAEASDWINDRQVTRVLDLLKPYNKVGVLGVTYKLNTPVTEESYGLRLLEGLIKMDKEVFFYDSVVPEICGLTGTQPSTLIRECDAVVLALPDQNFIKLNYYLCDFVIDCWNVLPEWKNTYKIGRG